MQPQSPAELAAFDVRELMRIGDMTAKLSTTAERGGSARGALEAPRPRGMASANSDLSSITSARRLISALMRGREALQVYFLLRNGPATQAQWSAVATEASIVIKPASFGARYGMTRGVARRGHERASMTRQQWHS